MQRTIELKTSITTQGTLSHQGTTDRKLIVPVSNSSTKHTAVHVRTCVHMHARCILACTCVYHALMIRFAALFLPNGGHESKPAKRTACK